MKEQLRNELIMAAQKGMDDDELDEFKDRLTMILSNYDIAARETHLALRDEDINKDIARDILADIDSLKNIKSEYANDHWISFYGALVKEQPISDGLLRDDLEKFIDAEIAKLEKELEKL